jgi:hypothetical protein
MRVTTLSADQPARKYAVLMEATSPLSELQVPLQLSRQKRPGRAIVIPLASW